MSLTTKSALRWTCTPTLDVRNPTIVFLHASWLSSTMFDETIAQLCDLLPTTNLLRVDVNGHGKTTAGRKTFTLSDQAEDVLALIEELRIPSPIIAGISMGATIALRMALSPSPTARNITALILLAATATASTPAATAAFCAMRDIWIATPHPSEEIMNAAIRGWGGDPDVDSERSKAIKSHWVQRHSGAESVNPVLECMEGRESVLERLSEVKVPVLLVHGELDASWSLEGAEEMSKAFGEGGEKVRWEVVKGSGHLVVGMREGRDVSGWIGEFVKGAVAETV